MLREENVNLRINQAIASQQKVSYAIESEAAFRGIEVDCSEGVNTVLFSRKAEEAFNNLSFDSIRDYPNSSALRKNIIRYWKSHVSLEPARIFLGDGSMPCLSSINRLFLERGDKVLGYAPQFSEYESDVKMWGCRYEYVSLREDRNYKFDEEEFISRIDGSHKLIYMDNPNNPTGQVIPLSAIEQIVRVAKTFNIGVILDEAYGEYMDNGNSGITLVSQYDNLICTRSFSKGYGLAGLRAGYMVVPSQLAWAMDNIKTPNDMSTIARHIAAEALTDIGFVPAMRAKTCEIKSALLRTWKTLRIAETEPDVSIMMVSHIDENIDLARLFEERRIKVVSGKYYTGIGANSVRVKVPCEEKLPLVIKAFAEIDGLQPGYPSGQVSI